MLDLSCPVGKHNHVFFDESTGREYVIPEAFVQKVKDELLGLYRRLDLEAEDVLEDSSD